MDNMKSVEDIIRISQKSFNSTERANQENQWALLSEFLMPGQSSIFNSADSTGAKKVSRLFSSVGVQANRDLSSAFNATLTNLATKFIRIRYSDEDLNNDEEAINWLEDSTKRIHDALSESNFSNQVGSAYMFYTGLGTMALLHEQSEDTLSFPGFRFKAIHLSEISFLENKDGIVDTVFRKFKLTAKQLVEKFPDINVDSVLDDFKNNPMKEHEILHVVSPREKEKVDLNELGLAPPKNRPFVSMYIHTKDKVLLSEGGYYEFPYYIARWETLPGEIYGFGPGHLALPTVRTLNKVREMGLRVLSRAAMPTYLAEQRNIIGNLDLRPGSLVNVRDVNKIKEITTSARFDVINNDMEALKQEIEKIFFLDKFRLPPRTEIGQMSVLEVARRTQEMQQAIGPTLSRLNNEFLTPLVIRSFKMMLRGGAFLPPPDIIVERGIDIDIQFVNSLARSQQIEDVTNIQQWVQDLAVLAQVKPEAIDYVNADGIAKHTARVRGVPEIAVSNDKEVQSIRQQRAQAEQAQQALSAGVQVADINSKLQGGSDNGQQ